MVAFLLLWIIFFAVGAYFLKSELHNSNRLETSLYNSLLYRDVTITTCILSALCTIILTGLLVSFVPSKEELVDRIEVCDISRDAYYITYREAEIKDSQTLIPLNKKRLSDSNSFVTLAPDGKENYIEIYKKDFKYKWVNWLCYPLCAEKSYIIYADAETISELRE